MPENTVFVYKNISDLPAEESQNDDSLMEILTNGVNKRITLKNLSDFFSSGKVLSVKSKSDIGSLPEDKISSAYLEGDGFFAWSSKNHYSDVLNDPLMGMFIPKSGGDGSEGAWVRVLESNNVLVEWFGATEETDSSQANNAAQVIAEKLGLIVTTALPALTLSDSPVFLTSTSYPKIILSSKLRIKSTKTPLTIPATGITGLTEFSTKLTGSSVAQMAGKYIHISNPTEVLTERFDPPTNTPYYKNSAVFVLNERGDFRPSLDMTFNDLSGTTISIFEPEKPIGVFLGDVEYAANTNITVERDNVSLLLGVFNRAIPTLSAGVVINGNNCLVNGLDLSKSNDSGQGYAINIGLSCGTRVKNSRGFGSRSPIEGRHGSDVVIENCQTGGTVGSHWGNNYKFINCDLSHIVYSGKDLSANDVSFTGNQSFGNNAYAVTSRPDVETVFGRLSIKNIRVAASCKYLFRAFSYSENFTNTRRSWDDVYIKGVTSEIGTGEFFNLYFFAENSATSKVAPPKNIVIRDVNVGVGNFRIQISHTKSNDYCVVDISSVSQGKPTGAGNVIIKNNDSNFRVFLRGSKTDPEDNTEGLAFVMTNNKSQELISHDSHIYSFSIDSPHVATVRLINSTLSRLDRFPIREDGATVGTVRAYIIGSHVLGTGASSSLSVIVSRANMVSPADSDYPVSPSNYISSSYKQG